MNTKSEVVSVPMSDGVKLSVHIHRPDGPGRVPAVMNYTPYRKGPLGGPPALVQHGYASVCFDIRGTGNSEGCNDSIYSPRERQDGYDMVEWIASQDWCNGNVGMWGISFGAVVTLQVAMAAPPHLKAAIVRSGTDDIYTEWTHPGGSPRPYMLGSYGTIMAAANSAPPDPAEVGDRWQAIWRQRLEGNVPWGLSFAENMLDGPFYRQRSLRGNYDKVRCAVFVIDGWADWYCTPLLRVFAQLKAPKRALIGPWSHQWPDRAVPGPQIDWLPEAVRWFDQHLKGIDTGVMREPPVTVFVRQYSKPDTLLLEDRGFFRQETAWPVARAVATPMYFQPAGVLSPDEPPSTDPPADRLEYDPRVGATTGMHGGGPFNDNWAMPLDQRPDEARSLTYTTPPLEQDVEVLGRPRAVLHFECSAEITLFAVKLCDVAPDGTSAMVTKGWLNTSHRHGSLKPHPLTPGQAYCIEVDLLECAYRFEAGHRIRVSVAAADFPNVWPTPRPCTNLVYRQPGYSSHMILPIAGPQEPPLPAPALKRSGPVGLKDLQPPKLVNSQDLIRRTASLEFGVRYGANWEHSGLYTVSADEPAKARFESQSRLTQKCGGQIVTSEARCITTSDEKALHYEVDVETTVDGHPHRSRKWQVSVPRTRDGVIIF